MPAAIKANKSPYKAIPPAWKSFKPTSMLPKTAMKHPMIDLKLKRSLKKRNPPKTAKSGWRVTITVELPIEV